jgi:hypothetical protein
LLSRRSSLYRKTKKGKDYSNNFYGKCINKNKIREYKLKVSHNKTGKNQLEKDTMRVKNENRRETESTPMFILYVYCR